VKRFGEATEGIDILSVGDTYFWNIDPYGLTYAGSLGRVFGTNCSLLLRPQSKIMSLAEGFRGEDTAESAIQGGVPAAGG